MKRLFLLFAALLLPISTLFGQNDPIGIQPFGTMLGNVDAATLNVRLSIPVVKKNGIGLPFSYNLIFNNNFWQLSVNGTNKSWQPTSTNTYHGWYLNGAKHTGGFPYSFGNACSYPNGNTQALIYSEFLDTEGNAHPFPNGPVTQSCTAPPVSLTLTDGSGIVVTLYGPSCLYCNTGGNNYATYPNGTVVTPGLSIKDVNGNTITPSSTYPWQMTDTLGVTELTISSSGTSPNFSYFYSYPGPGSTTQQVTQTFSPYTLQTNFGCSGVTDYTATPNTALVSSISLPDGSQYSFTYETTPGDTHTPHYVTGRLKSLTLPTGGTIQYAYTGPNNGINCNDGSTAGLNVTTPDGTTTYVRDTTNWNQTTVTQPAGNYAIYNFAAANKNGNTSPFYEVQRRFYTTAGVLMLTETTCYNGNQTNCAGVTTAPTLPISQIDKYTLIAGKSTQSRSTTKFDAYNNVTHVDGYDFGQTTPTRQTDIAYGTYTGVGSGCAAIGNGIQNHVCYLNVWDGSHTVLYSSTNHVYDSHGNETQVQRQVSGGSMAGGGTATYLNTNFTHNTNGTVATTTDANSALTTYHYDGTGGCNNGFVTSTDHPLSLTDSATWDCNGGVPLTTTDVNSKVTTISYTGDPFWRSVSVQDPTNATVSNSYGVGGAFAEGSLTFNGGASTDDSITYTDSLGRAAQTQVRRGPGSTSFNTVSYTYNSRGMLSGISVPCQANANTNCAGPFTTVTYDGLGRPLVTTSASGGTVTNTYTQNDVLSVLGPAPTGENTKRKQYEYDGLGQLTSVCEITSGTGTNTCLQAVNKTGFWTRYQYDALGRLTGICQHTTVPIGTDCVASPSAGQQTRTFAYDGLSRVTAETNPENGTVTYSYDAACGTGNGGWGDSAGDVMKTTDAAGNVSCYGYDKLHRLRATLYPSGPNAGNTDEKHFVYDSATVNGFTMANPKGRLVESYTGPSASKITDEGFSYTVRGELATFFESAPHSAGYYTITNTYWDDGGLRTLAGVSLPTINYNADPMGRPTIISTSGTDPVTATTYDIAGRATDVTFGSGDSAHFTFDNNSGLMTLYKETINGSSASGTLTWNTNGTLQKNVIADPFNAANAQTCTYGYDDLTRACPV